MDPDVDPPAGLSLDASSQRSLESVCEPFRNPNPSTLAREDAFDVATRIANAILQEEARRSGEKALPIGHRRYFS